MLGNRNLIADCLCDIFPLLAPYADDSFYVFANHEIVPGAIYILSRTQLGLNVDRVRDLVGNNTVKIILCNPFEGSIVMKNNCERLGIADLVTAGKISIIGGGSMEPEYRCLVYDFFMTKVLEQPRNLAEIARYQALKNNHRPFKFLFLNGRSRPQRKYLLEKFKLLGLLDLAVWSNLDTVPAGSRQLELWHQDKDLLLTETPIQLLDVRYEYDGYDVPQDLSPSGYIKYNLFGNNWADIYLKAEPYLDTYFSLVTETVFEYPYSFRTEKIWKPIAMGHPFVVAANAGYLKDLRELGFKTFAGIIDESYDSIANNQERIQRVAQIVQDLCQQDMSEFDRQVQAVCAHNQQHLQFLQHQVVQQFPQQLKEFCND